MPSLRLMTSLSFVLLCLAGLAGPATAQSRREVRVGERSVKELIDAVKSGKADEGTIRALLEVAESGDQAKLALLNLFSKTTSPKLRRGIQRVFVQAGPGTIGLLNEALRSPRDNQRRATIEVLGGLVRAGSTGGVRRLALLLLKDYLVRGHVSDRVLTLRILAASAGQTKSGEQPPRVPVVLPESLQRRELGPCLAILKALGKSCPESDRRSLRVVGEMLQARRALLLQDREQAETMIQKLEAPSKQPAFGALVAELKARLALLDRNPGAALKALEAIKERGTSHSFGTMVTLGQALFLKGQAGDAERAFRQAVARRPFSIEALSGLAACRSRAKDTDEAVKLMSRALAIEPRNGGAFFRRARYRWRTLKTDKIPYRHQRWDAVLADLEAAIKLLADDPIERAGACGRHGFLLRRRKRYEAAVRDLDEAIRLCEGRPRAQAAWLAQRGFLRLELKRWEKAIQDFQRYQESASPDDRMQALVEQSLQRARAALEQAGPPKSSDKPRGKLY